MKRLRLEHPAQSPIANVVAVVAQTITHKMCGACFLGFLDEGFQSGMKSPVLCLSAWITCALLLFLSEANERHSYHPAICSTHIQNATHHSLSPQQTTGNRQDIVIAPTHAKTHLFSSQPRHIFLHHDHRISKPDGGHPHQVQTLYTLSDASNNGQQEDWKKNLKAPTKDARPKTEVLCLVALLTCRT